MEVHYATTNPAKVQSLKRDVQKYGINVIQSCIEIPETRSDDVEVIAREKVNYAYDKIKMPVVALDAGFYINSLNGFPRAFVNFSLETIGLEGILKLVEEKERVCEFRHCLAYKENAVYSPNTFISRVEGTLSNNVRGEMQKHLWSKLSLIFIPKGHDKTLAEMNYDEYVSWSESRNKEKESILFAEWFAAK